MNGEIRQMALLGGRRSERNDTASQDRRIKYYHFLLSNKKGRLVHFCEFSADIGALQVKR